MKSEQKREIERRQAEKRAWGPLAEASSWKLGFHVLRFPRKLEIENVALFFLDYFFQFCAFCFELYSVILCVRFESARAVAVCIVCLFCSAFYVDALGMMDGTFIHIYAFNCYCQRHALYTFFAHIDSVFLHSVLHIQYTLYICALPSICFRL